MARPSNKNEFHSHRDYALLERGLITAKQESQFTYTFRNFFHPFVGELVEQLNQTSLRGMLDPKFLANLQEVFFPATYGVSTTQKVKVEHFPKQVDLDVAGPYSVYNWELLFHIPLTIAVHLSKNQRFAEAQRWFHYIFDPTANDTSVPQPERHWRFLAFRNASAGRDITELLTLLSKPAAECTPAELELKTITLAGYRKIQDNPFQPHIVARTRRHAYMYCVVMKYLDNLIAWGDHLFRQDTLEAINEATQLYVLAANLLGRRPERVPRQGRVRSRTYAQLKARGLDALGNTLVELEGQFPFNLGLAPGSADGEGAATLHGIGRTLYFCVPKNDKLLSYWDTVADRLFKLRHCMNLEGAVRQLALFEPPLDPGMLVRAAAAGIDVGSIVAGLNQPPGPLRARVMIQKALELGAEVRGLGSALLQAIEKSDNERLALLRQRHEIKIQELQQEVRFLQWKQAQESTQALLKTRAIVLERYKFYLRMLGGEPDEQLVPDSFALDPSQLSEANFDEVHSALVGQYDRDVPTQAYPALELAEDDSPAVGAGAQSTGKLALIPNERDEFNQLTLARDLGLAASIVDATGTAMVFIPDIAANLHYWGLGGTMKMNIGTGILKVLEITSKILQMTSAWHRDQGAIAGRTAGYERRVDDWRMQANLAGLELRQMGRQVIGSLIAEQIARHDYENVRQQVQHSREVDQFLREKFTNAELYEWMQGELSRMYYEYYRFAFDIARRAEQTLKREVMRPELDAQTLIKFNYWDSGRKGLLSGDGLYLDVKRMEMAFHEHNKREYELTKHVSLMQVDPMALVALRATGQCTVRLPESLFDIEAPGQYFRRIKTVALSILCVTGPYVSVNCRLTLLKSSLRKSPLVSDNYAREGTEDDRFVDSYGGSQSVVISSSQQDSGLFEVNLQDERYLPFETASAVSEWQIELPGNPALGDPTLFDYQTISDVVLHLRYTARDGGEALRSAAKREVRNLIGSADVAGSVRVFSVRHEFPTEWAQFLNATPGPGQRRELNLRFREEHYPFWSQGRLRTVFQVDLFAQSSADVAPDAVTVADRVDSADPGSRVDTLARNESLNNLLAGTLTNIPLPGAPTGTFNLYFETDALDDLLIAVRWGS
jgi:Tc toxin complex TcA C-terminal TcB-binding domain